MPPVTPDNRGGGRRSTLARKASRAPIAGASQKPYLRHSDDGRTVPHHEPDVLLVDPEFIKSCLTDISQQVVILEAHFESEDHPLPKGCSDSSHIPGAIRVHPSYLEAGTDKSKYYPNYDNPEDGNLLEHELLVEAIERIGIFPDTTVIVYGTEPDGPMATARLVWALLYAGVRKVRLLDGGLRSWQSSGESVSTWVGSVTDFPESRSHRSEFRSTWFARPELLATTTEVSNATADDLPSANRLVDVRQHSEWDGSRTDHYTFFSKAGHIPSANYQGDWENLVEKGTQRIGPMLELISQRWRDQGIIDADVSSGRSTLIFYCGTGWRSSIAVLVALLLGLRAKNYDDGFYGWSWDERNEIAFGDSG